MDNTNLGNLVEKIPAESEHMIKKQSNVYVKNILNKLVGHN